ncbi:MAG: DNA polymerase III subunit epsilon [Pseudomonadota bacterium]
MREIIFDTETTGIGPEHGHRIIEIGAVEMVDRHLTGCTYHQYLNPERDIEQGAFEVHGISLEQVKDEPVFADILDDFWDFFGDGTLVAHNARFDVGFFNAELARVDRPPIDMDRVVDTLSIARFKFPGAKNSLDALCARFGISNAHRTLHGALLDSELLAEVYIELTGGKQTDFLSTAEDNNANRNTTSGGKQAPQRQRPSPLPLALSAKEIEAHEAFIQKFGAEPVWQRWLDHRGETKH